MSRAPAAPPSLPSCSRGAAAEGCPAVPSEHLWCQLTQTRADTAQVGHSWEPAPRALLPVGCEPLLQLWRHHHRLPSLQHVGSAPASPEVPWKAWTDGSASHMLLTLFSTAWAPSPCPAALPGSVLPLDAAFCPVQMEFSPYQSRWSPFPTCSHVQDVQFISISHRSVAQCLGQGFPGCGLGWALLCYPEQGNPIPMTQLYLGKL